MYSSANITSEAAASAVLTDGDTASLVFRTFHTTQGWRPISAVHQPAMIAISVNATLTTHNQRSHRHWNTLRFQTYIPAVSTPSAAKNMAKLIMRCRPGRRD